MVLLLLRSCYAQCHTILFSPHFKSLSRTSKPFSLSLVHFSPKRIPNMSSKPSAFDRLMSGARAVAAAKKNKPPPPPSPKKRKTPDSTTPQNPNPAPSPNDVPEPPAPGTKQQELNSSSEVKKSKLVEDNGGIKKRPSSSSSSASERLAELKCKIPLLKKKAAEFDSKKVACWGEGERVPFIFLCLAFDLISNETGRIVITDIVCNALRTVMNTTPDDLLAIVYLLANRIGPAHEGLELGIGDASIIKALAEACGRTEVQIKKQYKELGDLGLVAKASRSSQSMMRKPDPLTVAKVFDTFRLIAKESGQNSQEKKKNHIKGLLVAATDCEPQYLIRLLQTKLRIGLAEQTLLAALGQAAVYAEKHSKPPSDIQSPLEEAAKIVKQVYSVLPVYDKIVPALLSDGVWNLRKTCTFTLGVPVGPMLAKPTKGVSEILSKFQNTVYTCEYKYDGERAQIHYMENGMVEIYSRNAERNTAKFPDVVAAIPRLKKDCVKSFVLDCELVAYDRDRKKILPFQTLITRARKNVVMSEIKVDVCIYAFDMLYLNGKPLIQEELKVRREHLYESFEEEPGYFQFATAITSNDIEEIQTFLEAAVNASCEGLIVKTLDRDATYEPSKRSLNWLKLKKDYMDTIGDSVDLVPIAAFHGRGKRTGVYGAFLLACYDGDKEEFQSICKIGTGFSEAMLEERSASLRSKVIPKPKPYFRYSDTLNPDVWFEPTEVWEVKAADLTISPVHRAAVGIADADKGISLRFPRLLRVREDKAPEQATSSEQIAELYNAQKHNHQNNQDDNEEE
ncbi:DNA ligase 1-like isoform X2 [Punica granatum]|uniref:DNA ligase n=1 Tax=Punica granatum TaxID=22663 RepID=A0A6P8DTB8_PUNGR|nr:DNA ligase 1-like isoform X2 [Punica granatum]